MLHQVLHASPKPLRELDAGLDTTLVNIVDAPSRRIRRSAIPIERRARFRRVVQRLKTDVDAETVAVPAADVEAARQGGRRELDRQRLAERRAAQIATHLAAAEAALASNDAEAALAAAESAALLAPEIPRRSRRWIARRRRSMRARSRRSWWRRANRFARRNDRGGRGGDGGHPDRSASCGRAGAAHRIDRADETRTRARTGACRGASAGAGRTEPAAGALDAALRATGEALGHDRRAPTRRPRARKCWRSSTVRPSA